MSATDPVPKRQAALLVAFMWVAYFLNYCDRQAAFAMHRSFHADLGMSDEQFGLVGTCFLWVYAFCCPIAGQLGDRFSKRLLVVLSLIVWSIVTVATGFASSPQMLLGLRSAMGIAESLYMSAAIALTANAYSPELRSRAIATLTTAQIAGVVAGSWFGGWMADHGLWRQAFFILGGVGVLYAAPYFGFLRTVREEAPEPAKSGGGLAIRALARNRGFLLLCVIFPVFVFGLWLIYGWFPTFLREKFSLSQGDAAFNATIYLQGATAVGLLSGGILADVLYRRTKAARLWLLTASLLLCAPCLHLLGNSDTLITTRVAAAGFGLFGGLLMGNIFPAAFEMVATDTRASAVGVLNFCGGMISGVAPLFGGLWKKTLGIDRLFTFTAVAYVLAGVALVAGIWVMFPRRGQRAR